MHNTIPQPPIPTKHVIIYIIISWLILDIPNKTIKGKDNPNTQKNTANILKSVLINDTLNIYDLSLFKICVLSISPYGVFRYSNLAVHLSQSVILCEILLISTLVGWYCSPNVP